MSETAILIVIIGAIIIAFVLYKWLKPYVIKHDTTLLFTGGLGSGKTLESVKTAIVLVRKNRFIKWKCYNFFKVKIRNFFVSKINKHRAKRNVKRIKKHKAELKFIPLNKRRTKPMLYSNIPIHFKTHSLRKKREWAEMLTEKHILLLKEITEYSVVLIDEFPQFVNQFMWNEQLVQDNLNEFITFFRHYIGGYFIANAQSENDIVVQIRRKLNTAVWCYDFKKHLFGLFYTNRMCDIMLSDNVSTMSTTMIEDNTKLHWGFFPPKKTFDTRCYSVRYEETLEKEKPREKWQNVKTKKVLRLKEYISPLDEETTEKEKEEMVKKVNKLMRVKNDKSKRDNN